MTSRYPVQIDTSLSLPTIADNFSAVNGAAVNRLRDAIINIESELGVKPSGISGTVRARVDQVEIALNNLADAALLPTGSPVTNDLLIWNGSSWAPSRNINAITLTSQLIEGSQSITTPTLTSSDVQIQNRTLFDGVAQPSVAGANQGSIYYDLAANAFKVSQNAGAYVSLFAGAEEITVGTADSSADYICDGVDDQVEINAAIDAAFASGVKRIVKLFPGTYIISAPIMLKSNVMFQGSGVGMSKVVVATGYSNSHLFAIGAYGTETTNTPMNLTVNAIPGEQTITVATGAELDEVEVDSYLFLATDALWSPEQFPNSNRKGGEYVKVKSVDTSTGVITIYGMVRGTYLVSDNSALYRMTLLENTGVKDIEIYQQAALTTRTNAPVMIGLQKGINVFINSCHVHDSDGPALSFHSNINSDIRDCVVNDLTDNTGSSQFGYGVVLSGACENIVISNNRFSRMRHAVTTGSIATASPANIILRGVQRGVLVYGNVGSHCTNTVFDTHAESENFAFIANLASDSPGFGIFVRNPSARVISNTIEWCQAGIKVGSNVVDVSSGQATGTVVVGNVIRNIKSISPSNFPAGISLSLTEHCIIQDNIISSCDGAGLELRFGSQFNIIRNNTFLNCNLNNNVSTLADAIYLEGAYSGSAASFSQSGTTVTATGLTNMSPSIVGKKIVITSGTSPSNNGTFAITSYISSSSVTWENASGVTDAGGAGVWHIEGVCDNIIENNFARNTGAALFESSSDGYAGHMKWLVRVFGGLGQNVRNIIRNNTGIGMESGLVSSLAGNFIAGNTSNEATPPKSIAGVPADTDFAATPIMGTIAINSSTGRLYFRTESAATWGDIIHARSTSVSMPVQTLQWQSTITNPAINQASTSTGSGNALLISAQTSTFAGGNGGNLFLTSGSPGAGGTDGSIRLGVGSGNTGIQINPSTTGQSLYSVVSTATSVRFQQSTTSVASATGAQMTIQAQTASGTTSIGGTLVLASGGGTSNAGPVRIFTGPSNLLFEAAEVAAGRNVISLARLATLTTTQMPTNTGNGVIYVGNAATPPSANPVSGAILYSEGGILKARNTDGLAGSVATDPTINGLRLTLTTGTPVITSDVASSSTVYLTPMTSGYISLFDGTTWVLRNTSEISIALSGLTSARNYDVFAFWNGSAVALELSAAWTNDTTRADALARQNGIWVKSGTPTRRFVGTFRSTGTTTTTDTITQRYVWNFCNQVPQHMLYTDATTSWSYNAVAFRQVRGQTASRVECVVGMPSRLTAHATIQATHGASGRGAYAGVGIDSTTTNSGTAFTQFASTNFASETNQGHTLYDGTISEGYHAINWLEGLNTANSTTIYGTSGSTSFLKARLVG